MEAKVAECSRLIKEEFPVIDEDLFQYITDVISTSAEDFESTDDVVEAVGGFLQQCDDKKTDEDIEKLCDKIMSQLHTEENGKSNGAQRVLNAPLQMDSMLREEKSENSIWIQKIEDNLKVDSKALIKADAERQKKLDKRAKEDKPQGNRYKTQEATASQVLSKKDAKAEAANMNTKDIRIENFDIAFGDHVLLRGANLTLIYGKRYGMVGRNGLGKSTLLKLISGGQLIIPSHISILHVEQEVTGDDTQALQSVLESWELRESLLKEEKDINQKMSAGEGDLSTRLTEVYAELEAIESDKAPTRAAVILAGLGFTPEMQGAATKTFSGGWRMRLALARALFCQPDLLLLDEPTNMLDMQAIIWLERYLQTWKSTLLVVSHDRNFLDEVPTDMLHLHTQRIDTYRGNYSEFMRTMTERHKSQQREYEAQMDQRRHIQDFIDKFRFNAKRASLVQSRIKQLERMPELIPVDKETEVTLNFPVVDKLSPPILILSEVSFAYEKKKRTIFSNVDLSATMESRICIVGENGAGKTTLLKLIMDMHSPTGGNRTAHRNLKFGYFSQHHVDQLDMSVCAVELMQKEFPGHKAEEYRRMLGCFGVTGDMALQQIKSLSGGQKSRVAFAILCGHKPNFLILDEPTNHLDIQTIEALGHALIKYKGGVILVSHDERLIRMVCQELWVCSKGKVYSLEGGFDEYRQIIEKELVLN